MPHPTLRAGRLILSPLTDEHLAFEIELDSDPAVMRYLGNGHPRTPGEVEELYRRRLGTHGRPTQT